MRTRLDHATRAAASACAAAALAFAPIAAAGRRSGLAAEAGQGNGIEMLRAALVVAPSAPLWVRGTARVETFGEIAVAQWVFPRPDSAGRHHLTVAGFTPYLRLRDTRCGRWFFDVSIGINTLSDLYETRDRRFSTRFQFSDHLAAGRSFGDADAIELSYRFVHYSNAGIRRPNPGVNFHVLRLEYRFP